MAGKITPELQVTPLESGLCSAAMLLHAHGCKKPTAELREELDLGRGGSTMPQLAELFTARGVPAEVVQATADEALLLDQPFIAPWGNAAFVIVEKIGRRWVTVVDPAIGRRQAPREEFLESYSGYHLMPDLAHHRPREDYRPPARPTPFRDAMRRSAGALAGVALMSVLIYLTDIGAPYLTQKVVDRAVVRPSHDLVGTFGPWVLAICAAVGLGIYLRSVFIARSAVLIGRSTSEAILDHLLGLPYRYFDSRQPGELAFRLGGLSAIRDSLSDQLFTGFFQVGGLFAYLGYLCWKSPILGAVAAAFVAAMLLVLFGSRHLFYSAIQNELSQTGRMQTEQLEAIQSILTIKTRPHQGQFLGRWRKQNDVSLSYLRRRMLLQGGVNAIIGILQFSGPMITLLVGIGLWRGGHISLGEVFGALAVSSLLFASANAIYGSVALFLICRTYARRIEDITMTQTQRVGRHQADELFPIRVDSVGFRYTAGTPRVVDDVDLEVGRGQTVAIVGHTGSGKSTLAKLMLGLYEPLEGEVSYGGTAVGNLAPSSFFDKLSFVPQDVTLETATLHDNVALGRPVSRRDVEWACRVACVHDDIAAFPAGYDTMVNNLGANFSGGQRQRIALARAVLNRPELLVLDEATSSLDTMTEVDITGNLRELGCTTVVIAHRLASVVDADVTYVMRQGRIVEAGPHRELMEQEGTYRSLFAGQATAA